MVLRYQVCLSDQMKQRRGVELHENNLGGEIKAMVASPLSCSAKQWKLQTRKHRQSTLAHTARCKKFLCMCSSHGCQTSPLHLQRTSTLYSNFQTPIICFCCLSHSVPIILFHMIFHAMIHLKFNISLNGPKITKPKWWIPLLEGYPTIASTSMQASWFVRSQHDKTNEQTNLIYRHVLFKH